ncbi:FmdE family protein [Methanothermobacter wolfeii]|uniref:FmdE family protein n=1 Tax=Methanothermobacter wolfeii TaxID=145261 RepID=UPI0024B3B61B|nr:FmdE family protein [Methanothermobacter wolfeii]MDI6703012.1 FmdE family protein [Methanothermobacter wolfeii]
MELEKIHQYINFIENFNGFASPGSIIGAYMLIIAKKIIDFSVDEPIYVTCETSNCLPDAFQAITKSTIGNGRLKIYETGKMAATINKQQCPGKTTKGIRIILDAEKAKNYPIIYDWYLNNRKVAAEEVNPELLKAGTKIYSWNFVDVNVPKKEKKLIKICYACKEPFINKTGLDICPDCYQRVR